VPSVLIDLSTKVALCRDAFLRRIFQLPLPSKTIQVAIPMMPGIIPMYRGPKYVSKNNRIPTITSLYDGWCLINELSLSILRII
jgi:hypothetical protein